MLTRWHKTYRADMGTNSGRVKIKGEHDIYIFLNGCITVRLTDVY